MNITIIGTGYVGLVTAASLAKVGFQVLCYDIDKTKIAKLKRSQVPIYEPQLDALVKELNHTYLNFTDDPQKAVAFADICFLAVPTLCLDSGHADLSHLFAASDMISSHASRELIVVNKCTAPVGTCDHLQKRFNEQSSFPISVVSNPEFLREGSAVYDCMHPERIIIGGKHKALTTMIDIYKKFPIEPSQIVCMSLRSAEMTKYAANVMLASRISLMNEFANICEKSGANILEVEKGIGADSRIGNKFIRAGIGFGGSCFPKDISALHAEAKALGIKPHMIEAIEKVNDEQKLRFAEKMSKQGAIKTLGIWGLSFKPNTDDIRKAPAIDIIKALENDVETFQLYDPVASSAMQKIFPPSKKFQYMQDPYQAAKHADAIALLTEWKEFEELDFMKIASSMKSPTIYDGRNALCKNNLKDLGYNYFAIGCADDSYLSIYMHS